MFVIDIIGGLFLSILIIGSVSLVITLPLKQRYPNIVTERNIWRLLIISLVATYLLQISDDSAYWGFSDDLYDAYLEGPFVWLLAFAGLFIWYSILIGTCALGIGMSLTSSLINNLDPSYESFGLGLVQMYSNAPATVIVNILITILTYSYGLLSTNKSEDLPEQ